MAVYANMYIFFKLQGNFDFSVTEQMDQPESTLLLIKVIYWHWWFYKDPFTSMETFHSTKDFS